MRTTLNIDDELMREAQAWTGIEQKTRIVQMALEALIEREAARALADAGGSDPEAEGPTRRRSAAG